MSWNPNQAQDPNQPGQDPNQPGQYGGYMPPPANNPYGAQQGGYQQGGYQYGANQQPPPYGQQQYGANQQPFGAAAAALGPTSMGMQANVAAGLSYLFGWIGGVIFFFCEKQNPFVRFNAMQSVILFRGLAVVYIVFL